MGFVAGSYEKPVKAFAPANGTTTDFSFTFPFLINSDVTVHRNGVVVNTAEYVLVGAKDNNGGTVKFKTAPAQGDEIIVMRETPFKRADIRYQDNGDLIADELNADIDRIWLAMQEQQTVSDDTMIRPAITGASWDAKGAKIQDVQDGTADKDAANVGQVKTLNGGAYASLQGAQAAQAAAAASQQAAAGSASQAAGSATNAAQSATTAAQHVTTAQQAVTDATTQADRAKTEADRAATESGTATAQAAQAGSSQATAAQQAQEATNQANIAKTEAAKLGNMNQIAAAIDSSNGADVKFKGKVAGSVEGTDDADLVTYRQLRAATAVTGQSAALINGVMNNFLGCVEWWNGVGTQLPAGYLKCSGQLLKRSDYPELWAAVEAGIFNNVTEALWQTASVPTTAENRVSFSTGTITTGADANFRLPDLNGDQPGSITGLYLRGIPDASAAGRGKAQLDGAPNITSSFSFHGQQGSGAGATVVAGANGAMQPIGEQSNWVNANSLNANSPNVKSYGAVNLDASKQNPVYGRSPNEIVPRTARGMWIIRVNGSFTAANTNFNVMRGVDTTPANGEVHYGGDINSVFSVAGKNAQVATFRGRAYQGGTEAAQIIIASNPTGSGTKSYVWELGTAGELNAPNDAKAIFANKGICIPENQSISYARSEAPTTALGMLKYDKPGNMVMLGNTISQLQLYSSTAIKTGQPLEINTWHFEGNSSANNGGAQISRTTGPGTGDYAIDDFFLAVNQYWSRRFYITNGGGTSQQWTHIFEMRATGSMVYSSSNNYNQPTRYWELRGDGNLLGSNWTEGGSNDLFSYINRHASDRRLKDDIKPIELDEAKAFVQQHKTYSWTYNTNGHKGHGMIADELTPDLKYTVGTVAGFENVEAVNEGQLALGYLVPVVRDLMAQVEELKAEVKALREAA